MLKILQNKAVLVVLVFIAGWLGISVLGANQTWHDVAGQSADMQARITALEQENNRLQNEQNQYDNPHYLEKQAREKLNYKALNETVVIIYKNDMPTTQIPAERVSWYRRWWQEFETLFMRMIVN